MNISRRTFQRTAAGALGFSLARWVQASPRPPKLLIWLVLQQFRTDYLETLRDRLLPGGFRLLMEQGSFFPDCQCSASSFNSSSLATLATGAWPEVHGIIADRWFERTTGRVVEARPDHLLASTFAEQVSESRLFIFGSGMLEARLLAGTAVRTAQVVATNGRGQMLAAGEGPAWLAEFNHLHPIENVHDARWLAVGAAPGVPPLRVLKYDASKPAEFYALYNGSPFAQAGQYEFLREWMVRERMGQSGRPDILIATFGPLESLGYEVGAGSPLMQELVLHLDREIETTLQTLTRTLGAGNFALAVSAAHGAPRTPENREAMAVAGEGLAQAIDTALSRRFDGPAARNPYVARYVYPFLYLEPAALRRDPAGLRAAAAEAAMALPQVAGYYTADGQCSYHGAWERRFRNSFHRTRSGDVMLAYRPGYVEDFGAGRGISYGSLYNYDTRVPLMLYGPPFRARVFEERIEMVDVAPTLARVTGIAPPSSSIGRVLGEAFLQAAAKPEA